MASGLYENGVKAIMGADIDLVNDSIAALLCNSSLYAPDLNNDVSQIGIPDAAIIAEVDLTGKTLDGTTFRADDTVFTSVESTLDVDLIVLLKNTNDKNTSLLIFQIDDAAQFPITPDGTDITIEWDDGANGIFKL